MFKSLTDIEFLNKNALLGRGACSEVLKVRLKSTQKIYALKKVK